jgi:hypothetical protein
VVEFIVPTVGLLLVHDPPGVALLSVVVAPAHTDATPVIANGKGLTVTVNVVSQPVGKV